MWWIREKLACALQLKQPSDIPSECKENVYILKYPEYYGG